jgi:predicted RNA binding protein YcfA (HicA-like mRNA interferase family)
MSKQEKLLRKIVAKPAPSDIRWSELTTLLKSLGYELHTNSGSRRKFFNKSLNRLIICHEPHPHDQVDKACINDVVEHLIENGLIEK